MEIKRGYYSFVSLFIGDLCHWLNFATLPDVANQYRLRGLILLGMLAILALVAMVWPRQSMAVTYTGFAQIDGPLQLELWATPAVVTPGNTLSLQARLVNQMADMQMPMVELHLPPGVQLQSRTLPSGVTLNLQTGALNWLPVVSGQGGMADLNLALRVETADIQQPEQVFTAVLYSSPTNTSHTEATIWIGIPPQIDAVTHLAQIPVGQPVQLRPDLSGSGPFTQAWLLGDGRRVDVNDPVVVYPHTGLYQLTLTAANPLQAVFQTQVVSVVPHPAAQFMAEDWEVMANQPVHFMNQSGGQPPLTYFWEFGDGTVSDQPDPAHAYALAGVYQVHLSVENAFGRSEAYGTVTVGELPIADLVVPLSVPAGQPLAAQGYGDDSVQRFTWDMGDGRMLEGESVMHTYRQPGDFYVLMTAVNPFGSTQVGRWVHVEAGIWHTYLPTILYSLPLVAESDPALNLPDIELTAPFVMTPLDLPPDLPPAVQLFYTLNEARRQFDLPPLNLVYELNIAAQGHTDDMSTYESPGHIGSDGSNPAERLLRAGYLRGYAGETTAWGFEYAYQAVEFWINSPAHRRIVLNENVTDVGVGFTVNGAAANVWYWTAEFGNGAATAPAPVIRLQQPVAAWESLQTTAVSYTWNWPRPLNAGESFNLLLVSERGTQVVGTAVSPLRGTQYGLTLTPYNLNLLPGSYQWQVRLQNGATVLAESEYRLLTVQLDPNLPTPTPVVTPIPLPTMPIVTPTPTPTPLPWVETPEPTEPPLPTFPTATP